MLGAGIGSLSVYQQELGKGFLPSLLWIRSGDQGHQWQEAEVNIKGYHQYKVIERLRSCNLQCLKGHCSG